MADDLLAAADRYRVCVCVTWCVMSSEIHVRNTKSSSTLKSNQAELLERHSSLILLIVIGCELHTLHLFIRVCV